MTWLLGSMAKLPITLLNPARKATWAGSNAFPVCVKLVPPSRLQVTKISFVAEIAWYDTHTLSAPSAAIHSRSSTGILAPVGLRSHELPPSLLVDTSGGYWGTSCLRGRPS